MGTHRSLPLLVLAGALALGCSKKSAPSTPTVANDLTLAPNPAASPPPAAAAPATTSSSTARETGSGMATGRRQYQPIVITKHIDKSTP